MPGKRWNKKLIIRGIRKLKRSGERINSNNVQLNHVPLYQAAVVYFGNWGKAVSAAGFNYRKIYRKYLPHKWSKQLIVEEIRKLSLQSARLNSNQIQVHHALLYAAAVKYFGGWKEAIKAAGFDYSKIRAVRPFRSWSKAEIVREIKRRKRKKLAINAMGICREDRGLYSAVKRYFGNGGMREPLRRAGFKLEELDPKLIWPKKKVVRTIRTRWREGLTLSQSGLRREGLTGLHGAGKRYFGTWRRACEKAGVDYKKVVPRWKYWSKLRVVREIRRLAREGVRLSSKRTQLKHTDLFSTALRLFRSWGEAVFAAGIDYRLHCTTWSYKYWIRTLPKRKLQIISERTEKLANERRRNSE